MKAARKSTKIATESPSRPTTCANTRKFSSNLLNINLGRLKPEKKIILFAYVSRITITVIQALFNLSILNHEAEAFRYSAPTNKTEFDKVVHYFFGGFIRWDAHYFMHIAKYGYTYENTLAFFPLYPLTVGFFGKFVAIGIGKVYLDSLLILFFLGFNVYLFKKAAVALFRLTELLFNSNIAYNSAIVFCFNPASVFFSAPYSECLFCFLTFSAMTNCVLLYRKYSKLQKMLCLEDLPLVCPIALSTLTRSNGILNIGFLLYTIICLYMTTAQTNRYNLWKTFVVTFTTTINCFSYFMMFQYYCYDKFCKNFPVMLPTEVMMQARENNYVLPGTYDLHNQTWCKESLPLAYSYVQNHYWNVGFMKYYQLKQLPNFLLATPILSLIIYYGVKHLYVNIFVRKNYRLFAMENPRKIGGVKVHYFNTDLHQPKLNVFYIHALFLGVFCLLFIHVQVSTRLICSASPVFYWVCAKFERDSLQRLILGIYICIYFVFGTIMFCNFLPWT